jgi:pimeloyl-ACP methyl ester carboxylesterase
MGNVVPALVPTPDGACLFTELRSDGSARNAAPITVVLLHGWTLDSRLWARQVEALPRLLRRPVRILTMDLRGHGRSTITGRSDATLEQLADDLVTVVCERAPEGPLVLVGHSLGGMTIMEYAHRHADEFGRRVAGVVLVSTSAEGAAHTSYGLSPQFAWVLRFLETQSAAILARSGAWRPHRLLMPLLSPGVRWLVFGQRAEPAWVSLTSAMVGAAPLCAIGGFRPAVGRQSRVDALVAMRRLPAAVLVGSRDRITPRACAETIATALPRAEHIVIEDAGHMLPLERPDEVAEAIARVVGAIRRRPRRRIRRALRAVIPPPSTAAA